jgi:hypothetical protein
MYNAQMGEAGFTNRLKRLGPVKRVVSLHNSVFPT